MSSRHQARKGDAHGYAALFVRECQTADQLPATIRSILEAIHAELKPEEANDGSENPELEYGDLA